MTEVPWGRFAEVEPELAAFGAERLARPPAYLATVRSDGRPRVHPVTPILPADALFVFMEPTSPKGRDLAKRGSFALHNGVPDTAGTGGEFWIGGRGFLVEDPKIRAAAKEAAAYDPVDRYVLFELRISEARCNAYGDVRLPARRRWSV
ncbi:MAG TPA: pyridoxamine 5'-phosphate oxidase family protein [Actinomycetota bacterium]